MRWFCHINRFLMLFISQPSSAVQNKFYLTAETMPHAFCKCKLPVLGGNPTPPHLDPHTRDRKNTLHCSNQIETDRDGARGRHQAATKLVLNGSLGSGAEGSWGGNSQLRVSGHTIEPCGNCLAASTGDASREGSLSVSI